MTTVAELVALFNPTGLWVEITRSGNDYWLKRDIDGTNEWALKLEYKTLWGLTNHSMDTSLIQTHGDVLVHTLCDTASTSYEYSIRPIYEGVTITEEWQGNGHGREQETGFVIEVDDVVTAVADGETVQGDEIVITRTCRMEHDDAAAGTNLGTSTTVYTIGKTSGLKVDVTLLWNNAGHMSYGYTCMMPVENTVLTMGSLGKTADYDIDPLPGATIDYHNGQADVMYAWNPASGAAALLYRFQPRWTYTQRYNFWLFVLARDVWKAYTPDWDWGLDPTSERYDFEVGDSFAWTAYYYASVVTPADITGLTVAHAVPSWRTVTLPAETRTVTLPAETRTATLPAETRTVTLPAETRTVTIPAETRTVTV